ncbi:MAG TPA: aldo/keto reductase [Dehalococcoidia bacterium]|nr:aldo/keto reductase [Dehalococcoidia bacterium]
METRRFGSTGLTVSALGFGCGAVGGLMTRGAPDDQVAAVKRALDAGITYFDTASMYGEGRSEENLGRVLRTLGAWDKVVVGTKVRLSEADLTDPAQSVRASIVASLHRLGRQRVDLLQLHNPIGGERGTVTLEQAREIAGVLRDLVQEGRIDHVGFTGIGATDDLHQVVNEGLFETVQCYFNAANPSSGHAGVAGGGQDMRGLIGAAQAKGMGVIAIRVMAAGALLGTPNPAPLSGGGGPALLTGGEYERDMQRAQAMEPLAKELGLESVLELSLRLVLAKQGVSTALVGYSDMTQLEDAIRWAERGPLPPDAVRRVLEAAS